MPPQPLFIGFLIALLALWSPAMAGEIMVVVSDRSGVYAEFADFLKKSLEGTPHRVSAVVTPDMLDSESGRNADVWVTVGSEATRATLARAQAGNVIAALVPRQSLERVLNDALVKAKAVTGIVLDQPAGRQMHLVQQVLGGKKRLGLLVGPEQRALATRLQQVANAYGISLEVEEVADDSGVVPAANRLLARTEALLALPDSLIYNRNNIRPILLASYRFQRPVIGYSAAFVSAGALAAIYTTPTQAARQVADLLLSGKRPSASILPPDKFSISYNRQVASSLGLDLPDEASVMRALEARRHEP